MTITGSVPAVYITGAGHHVSAIEDVGEQPLAGNAMRSVATSDRPAYELAAAAGAFALADANLDALDVDRLFYACSFDSSPPLWPPASWIARELGIDAPAMRVDQVSNGGMAAIQLGYELLVGPFADNVVVTTGDRHDGARFDRWRSDPGTVYGDGGTSLVMSTRPGPLLVRSVHTVSDPQLEGMHRPTDDSGHSVDAGRRTDRVDLGGAKQQFLKSNGTGPTVARLMHGQRRAVEEAVKDAGVTVTDIDWFVLPHLGWRRVSSTFLTPFDIDVNRTTWDFARSVGHLGPGDQIYGLDKLARSGVLRPGQLILLAGIGSGFSWSCAVLEVTDRVFGPRAC
nr:ketoacyl-ACP synthase III family protein [Rhodococcus sp. (in: high G+C Gram-positive bacteria)]